MRDQRAAPGLSPCGLSVLPVLTWSCPVLYRSDADRQAERPAHHARGNPLELSRRDGEPQAGKTPEQAADADLGLKLRQRGAQAAVDAVTERQVPGSRAGHV